MAGPPPDGRGLPGQGPGALRQPVDVRRRLELHRWLPRVLLREGVLGVRVQGHGERVVHRRLQQVHEAGRGQQEARRAPRPDNERHEGGHRSQEQQLRPAGDRRDTGRQGEERGARGVRGEQGAGDARLLDRVREDLPGQCLARLRRGFRGHTRRRGAEVSAARQVRLQAARQAGADELAAVRADAALRPFHIPEDEQGAHGQGRPPADAQRGEGGVPGRRGLRAAATATPRA